MAMSVGDTERAERVLKRSTIKRNGIIQEFEAIFSLIPNLEQDPTLVSIFAARHRDIHNLLSEFHVEQDSILDQLILLNREDEFSKVHSVIEKRILEQFYSITAYATEMDLNKSNVNESSLNNPSRIQLPKIKLPSFNGELGSWCSFRDIFTSLVHNNTLLSNSEKFHYLISVVSGNAASIVRAIPITDTNYTVAWEALHDRFDNKRILLTHHLDLIFGFTPMTTETLPGLKAFINTFQENISAIKALEVVDFAGFLLFYIASRVLSPTTKRLFETEYHANDTPDIQLLLKFIQTRCNILQNTSHTHSTLTMNTSRKSGQFKSSFVISSNDVKKCIYPQCKETHSLFHCPKFEAIPAHQRFRFARSRHLCMNCLSSQHKTVDCNSSSRCRYCSSKHHSSLHLEKQSSNQLIVNKTSVVSTPTSSENLINSTNTDVGIKFAGITYSSDTILLGTAVVRIRNNCGHLVPVRVLIDSGSQVSVITNACLMRLGLPRRHCTNVVVGLSQTPVAGTKGMTSCIISPLQFDQPEISCDPIILSKIVNLMPAVRLNSVIRSSYSHLEFADPSFDNPGQIDFLLGADIYTKILKNGGRIIHTPGLPSAYETVLGWILSGQALTDNYSPRVSLLLTTETSIEQLLQRFWEIEEPSPSMVPFTDNDKCEELFCRTTIRDSSGRYSVSLPFHTDPSHLGESYNMALSRFYNLERRLLREPKVYDQYRVFMREYEDLGHMKPASCPGKYFIPHHAVIKYDDEKLKLRVVFDASAKTSSNSSLNQLLFVGPKLQQEITNLLLRCRFSKYMFTADICKMYRQIELIPSDRVYQHILWRDSPSKPLCEFELCTVTYGVSSSPFQAIRVLKQLELDEGVNFPYANKILSTESYVDDIITGTNSVEDLLLRQEHLNRLLSRGGFLLKKWASNSSEVLNRVSLEDRINQLSLDPKDDLSVKILGLHWDPVADVFSYHTNPMSSIYTKRSVLSTIAKVYDPIGALAPITFWAKCFMQKLWQLGITWDSPLPEHLSSMWQLFSSELHLVSTIKVPRHIVINHIKFAQLIGFSDASEKGYSAVVYLRTIHHDNSISVYFITSKSKVAPLKSGKLDSTLTIPRLELCGALLLAQTLNYVQKTIKDVVELGDIYAWTDSTVVLSWLTSSPVNFKIFVSNRIAKISSLLPKCLWLYIPSAQNPADCVSRGLFPSQAIFHSLYWNGPPFLQNSEDAWPSNMCTHISVENLPEFKKVSNVVLLATAPVSNEVTFLARFSSLLRMQRVLSYVRRFINLYTKNSSIRSGPITADELEKTLEIIVLITQRQYFVNVFDALSSQTKISCRSIARLVPFIDNQGIIRVGGRLRNSERTFKQKHPILLPKRAVLTTLLIRHFHFTFKHAGQHLISSLIAEHYWILGSRSAIRHVVFRCIVCTRHRAAPPQPIMAQLPPFRVRPSRPFSHIGVDFAGPIMTKEGKRRNARLSKTYFAVFVCMTVKAIHLEIVSDLSTEAFIAALNRFVSRRGIPSDIYSDCGTNFVGAERQLRTLFLNSIDKDKVISNIPCKWHFNPPAAPHFGGIWEAVVKSTKYHLKRVIGIQNLTFEELSTLLTQIEAILNSRPLTPLSSDPNDLLPLTPGHFLIGQSLVSLPFSDLTSFPQNYLTRWELIRQFSQSFWNRWSTEYLTTLQGRSKWINQQPNVKIDDLVIVQTPNQAPTHWKMGRIEQVYPGTDGVVRVATIRTVDGIIKRPVVKLAVLPVNDDPF